MKTKIAIITILMFIMTAGIGYDYYNKPRLDGLRNVSLGMREDVFYKVFMEEYLQQAVRGSLLPEYGPVTPGFYQMRLQRGGTIGTFTFFFNGSGLIYYGQDHRYIRPQLIISSLIEAWREWFNDRREMDIPVESMQGKSANDKTAQQVDSAEASTIAVPPSDLSGSPR